MSYIYYPITGIKDGRGANDAVPVRRELKEWTESKDPKDRSQVILFILALKRFQAVPPESRDSYFQIAGIHGMPYTNWDEPSLTLDEAGQKGYCVHANALFPPFHRPYLLLYEQRIHEIMVKEIIPEQPKHRQAEWTELANTWRLPHWDWAKNPQVPSLLCWPTVTLTLGNDQPLKIKNPLYSFRMPNDKKMGEYGVGRLKNPDGEDYLEFGECFATNRCPIGEEERQPDSDFWRNGGAHHDVANKFLKEANSITGFDYGTASEMVYRLLTYPLDFETFGTLARDATLGSNSESSVVNDMNLEFIHNNVHYWVGGDGGHMSQIPVAAFDPLFWFHHCNIDRLFALWQTLNPDKWLRVDIQKPFPYKTIGMGDIVTDKTPMRPFHKDETGTVWMPSDARDWYKLGYTYPELQPWNVKPGADMRTELLEQVTEAYGINRKQALAMAQNPQDVPGSVEINDKNPEWNKDAASVAMNDYALSIKYSKFAMGGQPFNVEVYLKREGQVEETFSKEDYVTNVYNFSQPAEQDGQEVCSNCAEGQANDVQVTAYIPISSYIISQIKLSQLSSMTPTTVEKFLAGMYYRIVGPSGQIVEERRWRESLGLKVGVSHTQMTYSEDPTVTPDFDDPKLIPSLGTGNETPTASIRGVTAINLPVYGITQLSKTVSNGGTITFKSPTVNLAQPRRETIRTCVSLLSFPDGTSSADIHSEESYDVLLSIMLLPKRRVIQCNSKPAHRGFQHDTEIKPSQWFKAEDAVLRVDVKESQWTIWVDGQLVQSVDKGILGKAITHVHYKTAPDGEAPIFARDIVGTIFEQTELVPNS
ncbi:uncharacterized protein N0V89_009167 [Didymosphaeria variabile]|uniref:tyrosinase n=1 Tax=Didymosphaeria variabile TaxID=1932322 RepID=A0A9W8XCZ5_9PLEO|nr:uncharacterized protein N0V89_009167 [Didymosphaeria variabile]KAJ4347797.1 hypothetical protein N0V89_009167 [Didymosphaeria variabile]